MEKPHFMARRGTSVVFVRGHMRGKVRVIEFIMYTTDHAEADKEFDKVLENLKQDGWTVQIHE